MKLIQGPLLPKIDSASDKVIQIFKKELSQPSIKDNVVALVFYGSRLFGNSKSDYDFDLLLRTFKQEDYSIITNSIKQAKNITDAIIDFEIYYEDLINLNDEFNTGAQGCYFLYSWAYGDAIIGSNNKFKQAVSELSPVALKNELDRKIINYFCRVRHSLINEPEFNFKVIKQNLCRAMYHINLLSGNWGYEKIYGYSTDDILRRELGEGISSSPEFIDDISDLVLGNSRKHELYEFANKLHKYYLDIRPKFIDEESRQKDKKRAIK